MDELQENQEQHDVCNASFCSSFSRIRSDELNDMGYRLRQQEQPRSKSYDAELSVTGKGAAEPFGRFIAQCPTNADNFAAGSSKDS